MLISSAVVLRQSRREQTDFRNLHWASDNPAWDSGQNRAQNHSTGFASLEHDGAIRNYLVRNAGKHSLYLGPRLSSLQTNQTPSGTSASESKYSIANVVLEKQKSGPQRLQTCLKGYKAQSPSNLSPPIHPSASHRYASNEE